MLFLINVVFGLLAGWLADYLLERVGVQSKPRVIIATMVGLIVFLANLAVKI